MSGYRLMATTFLPLAILSSATNAMASPDDNMLHKQLERVAQQKIFFGHQSVGVNLLDGIKQLANFTGVPLRIVEVADAKFVEPGMIGQTFIAENGYPLKKLKNFETAMGQNKTGVDIALMKFCFIDFTADTDAKMLFSNYQATIQTLKLKNPNTHFVHVTAPLTIVEGGLMAKFKYFLGIAPLYGTYENLRRDEYNILVRQTYKGHEPLFDLARVESTKEDGSLEKVSWKGKDIPVLIPAYSDDGGHLNDIGKNLASRELIRVLASVPNHPVNK